LKNFVKSITVLLGFVRLHIFMVGLALVMVFVVGSIAYLRGVRGFEIKPDLTEVVIGGKGLFAYYWIGLIIVWLSLESIYWVSKVRDWWLRREELKKDMVKDATQMKGIWAKIKGNTSER